MKQLIQIFCMLSFVPIFIQCNSLPTNTDKEKLLYKGDYCPMQIGNYWIYDMLDSSGNVNGIDSTIIKDTSTYLGHKVFRYYYYFTPPGDTTSFASDNHYSNENDVYFTWCRSASDSDLVKADIKELQHNYKNEDSWSIGYTIKKAEYVGTILTPADSFHDCFKIYSYSDTTVYRYYAPNIGLIKTVRNGKTIRVLRRYLIKNSISL